MKTKPKKLLYLALFLVAVAISLPIQIMFLYGHTPFEVMAIATKLAPLNWVIMILAPITAWLAYRASVWLLAALPALVATVLHNNWLVSEVGTDYSPLTVGLGTGVFLLAMGTVLTEDIRQLLFAPERRWWLTPPRMRTQVHVVVKLTEKHPLETDTFDISEGGAFLCGTEASKLKIGTECDVQLQLDSQPIKCRAQVVRTTASSTGAYPSGCGLRFTQLDAQARKLLHEFIHEENSTESHAHAA